MADWTITNVVMCPGFCPMWPCPVVVVHIPNSARYLCPLGALTAFAAGDYPCRQVDCAVGQPGKCWAYNQSFPPGIGNEGSESYLIQVHCDSESISYPTLTFRYENHQRPIGDPDPNIVVCFGPVCLSTVSCECEPPITQHADRIGFTHGEIRVTGQVIIDSPTNNCRCKFLMAPPTDEIAVNCLCHDECPCNGFPTSFPFHWKCDFPGTFGDINLTMVFGGDPAFPFEWYATVALSGSCVAKIYWNCALGSSFRINITGTPGDPCLTSACFCGTTYTLATNQCEPFYQKWTCPASPTLLYVEFGAP